MTIRKGIFWSHLVVGLLVGLVVLVMSVTGFLATYENAITTYVASSDTVIPGDDQAPLTVDEIASIAKSKSAGARRVVLTFENRPHAPILVRRIGVGMLALDPYSGEAIATSGLKAESFFGKIISWHRWLGMDGDGRATGRALTGAANLGFLFLLVSGIYLWIPRIRSWKFIRKNMTFSREYPTSKARDYNWHHVLGFWAIVPLALIVFSGVVISYSWANDAYTNLFSAETGDNGSTIATPDSELRSVPAEPASFQQAFAYVTDTITDWRTIQFRLPQNLKSESIQLQVHTGNGVLPEQRTIVTYDRTEHRAAKITDYGDLSPRQKASAWMRFIHTGEQYGLIGSTIAGLASLAACLMVYTGFALAYRRLIQPNLRRRRQ